MTFGENDNMEKLMMISMSQVNDKQKLAIFQILLNFSHLPTDTKFHMSLKF